LNGDNDWRSISRIAKPAFVWCYFGTNRAIIIPVGKANVHVRVFEPKTRIDIRGDFMIGLDNIFNVHIDKVVERVYVLFDKTLNFEKSRQ
jgi:hypothetical protein